LRATGRVVFWPFAQNGSPLRDSEKGAAPSDAIPLAANADVSPSRFGKFWESLSRAVLARPGLILGASVLLLAPLAWQGLSVPITYNLLSELRPDRPSVRGTRLLARYFPPGQTGPVTVVAYRKDAQFDTKEGRQAIARLTRELAEFDYTDSQGQTVRPILAVRSLTEPLGSAPGSFNPLSTAGRDKLLVLRHARTKARFVSEAPPYAGKITRLELILPYDPFLRESIRLLDAVETHLMAIARDRESEWYETQFDFTGTTAGIRDLAEVTQSDQLRIQILVVLAVLAVLIFILRHPLICVYLIVSVLFGYFVTIGSTKLLFTWLHGETFTGLDWKVPIFLFVILIAVGEDYNIYLITRVFEEQRRLGPLEGLRVALARTGGIITSCGVIMAGTFASMATGTLRTMHELGFALSMGVLLDTFVIRTILVPAFLALWYRRAKEGTPKDNREDQAGTF